MEHPSDISLIVLTITKQREALYQLKHLGVGRIEIEILAYGKERPFFTTYDLLKFYPHTNVQQIRRSIQKLKKQQVLRVIMCGVKNRPEVYCLCDKGDEIFSEFIGMLRNANSDSTGLVPLPPISKQENKSVTQIFLRHPSYSNFAEYFERSK